MLKIFFSLALTLLIGSIANAQVVDTFYFNLYTDSLKKGTHNYINIDGKLSNGRWIPLTSKEIIFSSDFGKFDGNDLVIPATTTIKRITVRAILRTDTSRVKEITIYLKQLPDDEQLPTDEEILRRLDEEARKKKRKN